MEHGSALGGRFATACVLASLAGWTCAALLGGLFLLYGVQVTLDNPSLVLSQGAARGVFTALFVAAGAAGMATAQWLLLRHRVGATGLWVAGPVIGFTFVALVHHHLAGYGMLAGLGIHLVGGALIGHLQAHALGITDRTRAEEWTAITAVASVAAGAVHQLVLAATPPVGGLLGPLVAIPILVALQTIGLQRHAAGPATGSTLHPC